MDYQGRRVNVVPVDVTQAQERWNEYLLDDGSVLKVKLVVTKIFRAENERDQEGNPLYIFQSTNISSVNAPEHTKQ